jgi:hypothetical protein
MRLTSMRLMCTAMSVRAPGDRGRRAPASVDRTAEGVATASRRVDAGVKSDVRRVGYRSIQAPGMPSRCPSCHAVPPAASPSGATERTCARTSIIRTARLRGSANTPQADEISTRSAALATLANGLGHPGGDLAGSGDVSRGEVRRSATRDFRVVVEKARPGVNLQSFDLSRPDRMIGQPGKDQRGDSGAQTRARAARATVVDDHAAGGKIAAQTSAQ